MSGATEQLKVDFAYKKAALRMGFTFDQYRPSGISDPLNVANKIGTVQASFTPRSFGYDKPFTEKAYAGNGFFDSSVVAIGDYMVRGTDMYCFTEKKPLLPYYCLQCFRKVSIYRPTFAGTETDTLVAANIPCVITERRVKPAPAVSAGAPTDIETAITNWLFMLKLPLGTLQRMDRLVDDVGIHYEIETPQWNSDAFYELTATIYNPVTNPIFRAIADVGYAITLRTSTAGSYSPLTGEATPSYTDTSRRGVVIDFANGAHGQTMISQMRVQTGDMRCLMDGTGTAPTLSSLIIANGITYAVMDVQTINMVGSAVSAYELLLRR